MTFGLFPGGFYVIFRYASRDRPALGFVVKRQRDKLFSERHNLWRGFDLGPLYFRTYHKKGE